MTDRHIIYQDYADVPSLEVPSCASWMPEPNQPEKSSWAKKWSIAALTALTIAYVGEPIAPPEEVTSDKWYQQLSTPTPPKAGLHASLQQTTAIDPWILTQPEQAQLDKWYQQLSLPTPPLPGLHASQQQAATNDPEAFTQPETTQPDKWLRALEEPVRVAPRALDAPWLVYVGEPIIPQTGDATELLAFPPLEDPPVSDGPITIEGEYAYAAPKAISDVRWLQPLSEPVIGKLRFDYPQAAYVDDFDSGAETITVDKWYQPLAVPAEGEGYLVTGDFVFIQEEYDNLAWFGPLNGPVIPLPQPDPGAYAFVDDFTPAETITADKWLVALSEPVIPTPPVAQQQEATTDPYLLTQPEAVHVQWLAPFGETYPAPRAAEFPQPAFVEDFVATGDATLLQVVVPFSEPVRTVPVVAWQQDFTIDPVALTLSGETTGAPPGRKRGRKWYIYPDGRRVYQTQAEAELMLLDYQEKPRRIRPTRVKKAIEAVIEKGETEPVIVAPPALMQSMEMPEIPGIQIDFTPPQTDSTALEMVIMRALNLRRQAEEEKLLALLFS